jgi:hypothetical protein
MNKGIICYLKTLTMTITGTGIQLHTFLCQSQPCHWLAHSSLPGRSASRRNFAETKDLAIFILDQNVSLSKMTATCWYN